MRQRIERTGAWGNRRSRVHAQLAALFTGILAAGMLVPAVFGDPVAEHAATPHSALGGTDLGDVAETLEPSSEEVDDGLGTEDAAGGPSPSGVSARSSSGAGGGAGAAEGPASTAVPVPLTASDVGVTPTAIRIGVPVIDLGNLSRIGDFGPTNPEQQRRAWQAFIDDINERGGIHGRQIEPVYRAFDALSGDDQRAACLYFARDAKVFAVVGGFNLGPPHDCLAAEHGVPTMTLGTVGVPDEMFERAGGRLLSLLQKGSRVMNNFVDQLHRQGALRGKRIGVTGDESSDPQGRTGDLLVAALKQRGYTVAHRTRYEADYGTAASQVPVEVQQMRSRNVDAILMISHSLANMPFVQHAEGQGYRPAYFTTDWGAQTLDATTNSMPESFDGAIGVTSFRFNDGRSKIPEGEQRAACIGLYERRTGTRVPRADDQGREGTEYGGVMTPCVMMAIFREAAEPPGPVLTRAAYTDAIQRLGPMPILTARVGPGGFGPMKTDAADSMRLVRWEFDCKCWEPVSDFRRTAF